MRKRIPCDMRWEEEEEQMDLPTLPTETEPNRNTTLPPLSEVGSPMIIKMRFARVAQAMIPGLHNGTQYGKAHWASERGQRRTDGYQGVYPAKGVASISCARLRIKGAGTYHLNITIKIKARR